MAFIRKIRRKIGDISEKGLGPTLQKLFSDHIYKREAIILLRLKIALAEKYKRIQLKDVAIIRPDTLDELAPLCENFPQKAEIFKRYFADGNDVFFAKRGREVMGYCWATTKPFFDQYMHKHHFVPQPDEVYHFDGFAKPEHRGKLTTLLLITTLYRYYQDRGYEYALCAVSEDNHISMRFHEKLGFEPTGEVLTSRKLIFHRWTRSNRPTA